MDMVGERGRVGHPAGSGVRQSRTPAARSSMKRLLLSTLVLANGCDMLGGAAVPPPDPRPASAEVISELRLAVSTTDAGLDARRAHLEAAHAAYHVAVGPWLVHHGLEQRDLVLDYRFSQISRSLPAGTAAPLVGALEAELLQILGPVGEPNTETPDVVDLVPPRPGG